MSNVDVIKQAEQLITDLRDQVASVTSQFKALSDKINSCAHNATAELAATQAEIDNLAALINPPAPANVVDSGITPAPTDTATDPVPTNPPTGAGQPADDTSASDPTKTAPAQN